MIRSLLLPLQSRTLAVSFLELVLVIGQTENLCDSVGTGPLLRILRSHDFLTPSSSLFLPIITGFTAFKLHGCLLQNEIRIGCLSCSSHFTLIMFCIIFKKSFIGHPESSVNFMSVGISSCSLSNSLRIRPDQMFY